MPVPSLPAIFDYQLCKQDQNQVCEEFLAGQGLLAVRKLEILQKSELSAPRRLLKRAQLFKGAAEASLTVCFLKA